jgi:phosphopantetheine adenylyltransferase
MKKSFKQFVSQNLRESSQAAVFTFGRFNPPTTGHEKLISKVASINPSNYFIFASQSQDADKNPLNYREKIKYMRQMFSKHGRNIIENPKIKNVFDIATFLYEKKETSIIMVVGQDRIKEFETLLNKYNGVKAKHGFYEFDKIEIVSAGERDPDADDVVGMSASKMRAAAANNDFETFSKGIPSQTSLSLSKELFNVIRQRMNIKEQFKEFFQSDDIREKYVSGKLFSLGDKVLIEKTNDLGKITHLGCNYVIIENLENKKYRCWINDIKPFK